MSVSWSGALPPPDALRAFGDINPTYPDRIVAMAEQAALHKQARENRSDETNDYVERQASRQNWLRLVAPYTLALVVIGGGIVFLTKGNNTAGFILLGTGVLGTILSAISGRSIDTAAEKEAGKGKGK